MSTILYYSNYCEHSKKLLQFLLKCETKNVHFICIDNRVKDQTGKIFIVLQNGQKILMPANVTSVPALLLISDGYKVLYGKDIYGHFKPRQEEQVVKATMNNMEPMAFAFGGFSGVGSGIASDNYSFYGMDSSNYTTQGNGGTFQMHSYSGLNEGFAISTPTDDHEYKSNKIKDGEVSLESLQKQRDQEINNIQYRQLPPQANMQR
jgi:hypothetical protein